MDERETEVGGLSCPSRLVQGREEGDSAPSTAASLLPPGVLDVIYGRSETVDGKLSKAEAYNRSLKRWWVEYSDRKNADEEEHPCDSLYYDRNTLPRTVPPPDVCEDLVQDRISRDKQQQQ